MPPAQRNKAGQTVPRLFNDVQKSKSGHKKALVAMQKLRAEDPDAFFDEYQRCLQHAFVASFQREVSIERVMESTASLLNAPDAEHAEEAELFQVALLEWVCEMTKVSERAVRYRACQLLHLVLNGMGEDAELDVDSFTRIQNALCDRLRDREQQIRQTAAKAMGRLLNGGNEEDPDFANCEYTKRMIQNLNLERSADVRKSYVSVIPPSDAWIEDILQRMRDEKPAVRKMVFVVLAQKVELNDLLIEQRVRIVEDGLGDRDKGVRDEALRCLWLFVQRACNGDVRDFLEKLDVEMHEGAAETALRAFIDASMVDPLDVCRTAHADRGSLHALARRQAEQGPDAEGMLLSSQEALYWRVVLTHLHARAAELAMEAARAVGHRAQRVAAEAEACREAMDAALPGSVQEMMAIVATHCAGVPASRYAARQLLTLANTCQDLTDFITRQKAQELMLMVLVEDPMEQPVDEHGHAEALEDIRPGGSLVGQGGDGRWEDAVMDLAAQAWPGAEQLIENVLPALEELLAPDFWGEVMELVGADVGTRGSYAHWMQMLRWTSCLLQRLPPHLRHASKQRLAGWVERVVVPALRHPTPGVRKEAVEALGNYLLADKRPQSCGRFLPLLVKLTGLSTGPGDEEEGVWAHAAKREPRPTAAVRAAAARVLCDLSLQWGPRGVDRLAAPTEAVAGRGPRVPILDVLLAGLELTTDRPERAAPMDRESEDNHLRSVCARGLCKVLYCNHLYTRAAPGAPQSWLEEGEAQRVLLRLLLLAFDPETASLNLMRQMMNTAFTTYCVAAPQNVVLLTKSLLAVARKATVLSPEGVAPSKVPAVMLLRYLGDVLAAEIELRGRGPQQDAARAAEDQREVLASYATMFKKVLAECLSCPVQNSTKPYLGALAYVLNKCGRRVKELPAADLTELRLLSDRLDKHLGTSSIPVTVHKDFKVFFKLLESKAGAAPPLTPEEEEALLQRVTGYIAGLDPLALGDGVADWSESEDEGATCTGTGTARGRKRPAGTSRQTGRKRRAVSYKEDEEERSDASDEGRGRGLSPVAEEEGEDDGSPAPPPAKKPRGRQPKKALTPPRRAQKPVEEDEDEEDALVKEPRGGRGGSRAAPAGGRGAKGAAAKRAPKAKARAAPKKPEPEPEPEAEIVIEVSEDDEEEEEITPAPSKARPKAAAKSTGVRGTRSAGKPEPADSFDDPRGDEQMEEETVATKSSGRRSTGGRRR